MEPRLRQLRFVVPVCVCLCALPLSGQPERAGEKNPFAGDSEAIAAGKKLYEESCQLCHGGDARGGRGPALASGEFLHGSEDGQIFREHPRGHSRYADAGFRDAAKRDLASGELYPQPQRELSPKRRSPATLPPENESSSVKADARLAIR